jgi:hypothetical protein
MDLGRFNHHSDPAIDFCVEVEELEGIVYDLGVGLTKGRPSRQEVALRIEQALTFRVGGDKQAVVAQGLLRELEAKLRWD